MPEFSATEQVNPDFNTAFNQAALQGVERQKSVGGLNALQGVDLNDPQSVNNAISNSVKSGNLDQATALMGLSQNSTAFKNIFPVVQQKLAQYQQQQSQPQQQAASPQDSHAAESMNLAATGLSKLKDVPTDQRDQAIADLSTNLQQRGIPAQAIQSASDYITSAPDKATQDSRIDELVSHYQGHADNFSGAANNTIEPHSTSTWSKQLLNDPVLNDPFVQGFLKKYGYDIEPQMGRAVQLEMPGITKDQELSHAGPIAAATGMGKLAPDLLEELGKTNIKNQNEPMDIYLPGSTQPQQVTRAQAVTMANNGVHFGSKPEPGAEEAAKTRGELEGGFGPGTNKVDAQNKLEEEKNLTTASQAASTRLNSHQYDENALTARQIIGLGSAVGNSGVYTKDLGDIAQKLAPILPQSHIAQYANNTQLLAQDLSQATKLQFSGSALPRIASEFNTITKAVPSNASPQDTIKLYGALMLAKNNFDRDADSHITDYQINPTNGRSQTAAVKDFDSKRPDLLAYALPELQNMKINGQPAVEVRQKQDGTYIGKFMPGSKNAVTFYIGRTK